jgi:phospholipid/cholesterol/gamma-HCH transport system substrate-binding protein
VLNDSNRKAFADTLTHLNNLTASLDKDRPDLDHALHNISLASDSLNTDLGDLHQVLGHADQATIKIDHVATDLDTQINSAQIAQFVTESRALVQSLTVLSNKIGQEPSRIIFGDRRKGYTPP